MTQIEIADSNLKIEVLGWHKLWSFKSRLEFPLEHVVDVQRWQAETDRWYHGLRAPGTSLPGVIVAGSYHRREQGAWRHYFYDVRKFDQAVVITLKNEWFSRVIVEVKNPDAVAKLISNYLEPVSELVLH